MSSFYESGKWRTIRYRILRKYGFKCMACGKTERLHVDHIKPRSKYPELELSEDNLQVLCEDCNLGKSNIFEDSFVVDELGEQEKLIEYQLKNLDEMLEEKGIAKARAPAIKKALETESKRLYLERKSRDLVLAVRCGGVGSAPDAIEKIMEIHKCRSNHSK